jgi:hypothetical protein
MKEFLLIFRRDFKTPEAQPSPEKMQAMLGKWQDWMGSIAAQNKLVDRGNRLEGTGSVVCAEGVMDGPYVEVKEGIGGYTIIRAGSQEDAVEISKGCPVLLVGGSVEVRAILPLNM